MLQLIRDHAQGIIIWIIVGFLILGLSSFILSSYLGGGAKNYVARVNDVEISNREYQIAFNNRQAQLQQQLGENFARFFNETMMRNVVVNSLVNNELLNQLSQEAGMKVGATQIENELSKIPALQDESGKFSKQKYDRLVAQIGYSPEGYAREEARRLANQQLLSGISQSSFVLPATVSDFEALARQQRQVALLVLDKSVIARDMPVSDEEAQAYYQQHASEFMTDEQVKVAYIQLDLKDLIKKQEVDEDEIRDFYNKNKARYQKDDFAPALTKIQKIAKRLKAGESFDKLAKEFSEDAGSAKNGGELGFFGKGLMDKPFEDAVYKLKKGQISQPVKSRFGYHLIQLEEIDGDKRRARHILIKPVKVTTPYSEIESTIKRELQTQKAERIFYEQQAKLENLTYEHQDSLEPAADALSVPIQTSPYFSRAGGAQIFRNPEVIKEAFSSEVLEDDLNSQPVKLSDDHLIVLRLSDHKPAMQKPFAEVKSAVEAKVKQDKATTELEKRLTESFAKLKKGESAAELAKQSADSTFIESGFIGRQSRLDAGKQESPLLSPEVRKAVFSMAKPAKDKPVYYQQILNNGNGVIIQLLGLRENPQQETQAALQSMQDQLSKARGESDTEAVFNYMREHSQIDINNSDTDSEP